MAFLAPYRVLFVCLGNICRSPAAEIVFGAMSEKAGLAGFVEADSAGTIDAHRGSPPDARMVRALAACGYSWNGHLSRCIAPGDWDSFDLIVAMDRNNMRDARAAAAPGTHRARAVAMCDYAAHFDDPEVPDPYWSGDEGFLHVVRLLEDCCGPLVSALKDKLASGSRPASLS